MRFKIFGVLINLSVPFAVLVSFLLIKDKTGLMIVSLLSVIIHETGHLIAMKKEGCPLNRVDFNIYGITIIGSSFFSPTQEIKIALAGPISNILTAITLITIYQFIKQNFLMNAAAVNIILGFVNLIPVKGLDGGNLLYNFLLKKLQISKCNLIFTFVCLAAAIFIIAAGITLLFKYKNNPSLLLLGIYLLVLNIFKIGS